MSKKIRICIIKFFIQKSKRIKKCIFPIRLFISIIGILRYNIGNELMRKNNKR